MGARGYVGMALMMLVIVLGSCGNDGTVTPIDTVAPNPPVGVMMTPDGTSSFRISWTPNAELDLAGYKVYSSSSDNGPFGLVTTGTVLCPWYNARTAPMDVTCFKVTAIDRSGNESAYSQMVTVFMSGGKPGNPSTPDAN